ncbi:MAG: hypothetical protein ACXWJH_02230 [Hyphomicrobium sp.]
MNSVTQQANELVGIDPPTSWRIDPKADAEALPPGAGALKQILLMPEIEKIVDAYHTADAAAGRAQKTYKHLARLAAWTGFGAALIGSLVLMLVHWLGPGSVLSTAAGTQAVLLLVSLGTSLVIGRMQPFEAWMLKRADAENFRGELFDKIIAERATAARGTVPLLALQLEYFRRHLLDVERKYYRERGEQHAAAARAAWWWRLVAFLLIALAAFPLVWSIKGAAWLPAPLADITAHMPNRSEEAQRIFLGIGIIAASLQGLLAAFAVMSLDERNAARYRTTADNLDALAGRPLEEARAAAAASEGAPGQADTAREAVLAFVALVQSQISSEHREWIALRKVAPDLALDRLKSLRLPPRT